MAENNENTTHQPTDAAVEAILASGAAGVDTALRVFEVAEHAYFGAVAATTSPEVVTTTAVSPYAPDASWR
jgi:hypothetical protein